MKNKWALIHQEMMKTIFMSWLKKRRNLVLRLYEIIHQEEQVKIKDTIEKQNHEIGKKVSSMNLLTAASDSSCYRNAKQIRKWRTAIDSQRNEAVYPWGKNTIRWFLQLIWKGPAIGWRSRTISIKKWNKIFPSSPSVLL